ncbi:type II CAAX endopeptidase family protein [Oceanihabitans sp. 2_MG-2023]|uniref:CPBP family intramembrane glutamic endopeptidase n=1 Tax=Oceanihabitans sp. 2_MG-2023 TaxID=3062661 RepID=UPI0026E322D9|nr:type II CAAX endopeptidase family protein [Oceanihabitans sp. 2_MG-2023]MDO6597290.1 type II CAAX endopeptidase family protein [Oceanihabitans sp. 2_MG-2023]
MESNIHRYTEFFILFILLPVSFVFNYSFVIKLILGVIGFVYVIYILLKVEGNTFKINPNLNWKHFWKVTFFKTIIIGVLTTIFVWYTSKDSLFNVVLNKPFLWLAILFVYSVFSVYPQELIYRTFYFQRYKNLFVNHQILMLVNAIVFSLAHLFFKNSLVILLTFVGGLLFAFTFHKTKSTFLVSIEHAIYGCWLFTVGMGEMLGFPT